jgi:hypothetical protein
MQKMSSTRSPKVATLAFLEPDAAEAHIALAI